MALNKKATIGIIVGIVALLLLLMIIAVIFDKKKLKSEDEKKKEESKDEKKEEGKEKKTPPSKTQPPQIPQPKPVFKDLPKPEPKKEKTDELYNKPVKKIALSVPDLYREKIALPDISNKKDISVPQLNGKSHLTFQANIKEHQFNPPSPPPSPPPPPPGQDGPPKPPPGDNPPPSPQIKPINPNVPAFDTGDTGNKNTLDVE